MAVRALFLALQSLLTIASCSRVLVTLEVRWHRLAPTGFLDATLGRSRCFAYWQEFQKVTVCHHVSLAVFDGDAVVLCPSGCAARMQATS